MLTENENASKDAAWVVLAMLILMCIIPYRKFYKHEHENRVKPAYVYVCILK